MINPRKEGKFVTEKRCSCPTSQLNAIKFNKVQCKTLTQSNKNFVIFCFAFFFFIIFFGHLAVMIAVFDSRGMTILYVSSAIVCCFLAVIMTLTCVLISEFTHTALEVLYKCRSCGHEVHVTYEVLPDVRSRAGGEIFNSYGRYTRTCQQPKPLLLKTTAFDDVERAYRNMSPQNDCARNSLHWTRQMIKRLR
ncbi:hypothetical protein GPALN_006881 [Globodera pallida]|nr:hypothetical protein GPALN_006881 [Globodera pallida]